MEITPGITAAAEVLVDDSNTAKAMGSGSLPVFATPALVALMEKAAVNCLADALGAGQSSVGTKIEIAHTAATPVGLRVSATATVTAVDGRRVDFELTASDGTGEIGRGTHSRVVIDAARFMGKAQAKTSIERPTKYLN